MIIQKTVYNEKNINYQMMHLFYKQLKKINQIKKVFLFTGFI